MIDLRHARAEDWLPGIASGSVALAFLDPPYHRVLEESWDRQWKTAEEYLEWLGSPILDQVRRVLADNGSLYLCSGAELADRVSAEVVRPRFRKLSDIVWAKWLADYPPGDPRCNWKQTDREALRAFKGQTERIIFAEQRGADSMALGESGYAAQCAELRGFVFEPLRAWFLRAWAASGLTRTQVDQACRTANVSQYWFLERGYQLPTAPRYQVLRALAPAAFSREYEDLRREYEDLRRPFTVSADVPHSDVWAYPTVPAHGDRHPAEKPLEMLRDVIRASSREGDVVLDCFAGRATTAAACVDTGRSFIGCEADAGWHAAGLERIEKHRAIQERRPIEGKRQTGGITGPLFGRSAGAP